MINHFDAIPDAEISPKIFASEIVKKQSGSILSSHKIFIPPNTSYPVHFHPTEHIVVILEGGGYPNIWNSNQVERSIISAGATFFVPANIPHQVGADARGMIMLAVSADSPNLLDPSRLVVVDV